MMHIAIKNRRQFLRALGLSGAGLMLPGTFSAWQKRAHAQSTVAPTRLVFFITPHGSILPNFRMNVPGLASGGASRASIANLAASSFSPIMAPLEPHKRKIQIVEGLSRVSELHYEYRAARNSSLENNRHHMTKAMLLTNAEPVQRNGAPCYGGATSIDQVIGRARPSTGRLWEAAVFGSIHEPGLHYNFARSNVAADMIEEPSTIFADIMGTYRPPTPTEPTEPTEPGTMPDPAALRAARIQRARGSVLDHVAGRYDRVRSRLSTDDQRRFSEHADWIRSLETRYASIDPEAEAGGGGGGGGGGGTGTGGGGTRAVCELTPADARKRIDGLGQMAALALACDMTRVVTIVTPNMTVGSDFGYSASANVHQDYAHGNVPDAADAMTAFNRVYAESFARLLTELDSVAEGDGTLLDHTMVIWLTELGHSNNEHELYDTATVVAGGANGFLRPGQYVRYPLSTDFAAGFNNRMVGAPMPRLLVTAMRAMGMTEDRLGMTSVPTNAGGGSMSLTGVLSELLA